MGRNASSPAPGLDVPADCSYRSNATAREMSEPFRSISRRRFGLVLCVNGLAGCGFGPFDPQRSLDARAGRLRILSPWGDSLRQDFESSLARWRSVNGMPPVSIRWLTVTDGQLATASPEKALQFADVILGGRSFDQAGANQAGLTHATLKPCRYPVIESIPGPESARPAPVGNGPQSVSWPLEFGDDPADPVTNAYFLSIFEDAPDQAAGYARWIRTVGTSLTRERPKATAFRRITLIESRVPDRSRETLWAGGPGTLRVLGLDESAPIHWPERMIWNSQTGPESKVDLLVRFCTQNGWFASRPSITQTGPRTAEICGMMARLLRLDCRDELIETWAEIQATTGERRPEAETYLTTPPPWPPASIQRLRQVRGFEYVVALADQLAIDATQRDVLIDEFGKPDGLLDFRVIESADRGRLAGSTRFVAWLHAEWAAWVKQRCRRTVRYLRSSNVSMSTQPNSGRSRGPSIS